MCCDKLYSSCTNQKLGGEEKEHIGDAQEIESLRDVAYNDTVIEIGRPEFAIPLSPKQQILKFLA